MTVGTANFLSTSIVVSSSGLGRPPNLDGKMLKKLMQMSKYREMLDYIHVPDDDFLLSDIICTLMSKFVPGVTA